jgi:hypothetical protein
LAADHPSCARLGVTGLERGSEGNHTDWLQGDTAGRALQSASDLPPSAPAPCPVPIDAANFSSTYPPFELTGGAATVVQFAIMLYMLLGLAVVCDAYFEAALSRICEVMSLKRMTSLA